MGKKFPEQTVKPDDEPAEGEGNSEESEATTEEKLYPAYRIDTSTPIPTIKQGVRRLVRGTSSKRTVDPVVLSDTLREWGVRPSDGKLVGGSIIYRKPPDEEDEE
ncbi:hypothetical protein ACFL3T_01085 [Patescibacteria group bacterium]